MANMFQFKPESCFEMNKDVRRLISSLLKSTFSPRFLEILLCREESRWCSWWRFFPSAGSVCWFIEFKFIPSCKVWNIRYKNNVNIIYPADRWMDVVNLRLCSIWNLYKRATLCIWPSKLLFFDRYLNNY